ncbi:MAG: Gfo/Idh/MocA family oxidoreductase [Phycisphaerales bacterium]|nr:Gfo/Idh/MocA family oxidoreductase [Phycisphaerales bacterium]
MRTIRWGIIGCGDVCEVKSGPGFQKARGSELVAVMRRDGAKAADFARRHGVARWYDDADALIADKDVDAVYVATPPGVHAFYAMKVCTAGKPCYVEKPMARNGSEARRMVEGFHKAKIPLYTAYYRRAMPRFLKVKEIVDSGGLGELRTVEYRFSNGQASKRVEPVGWHFLAEHSGGGLLLDLGSHALDLLDYFVGPLRVEYARAGNLSRQYEVEDHVGIAFSLRSGVVGAARWKFDSVTDEDMFEIGGPGGTVFVSCFGNEPIVVKYADGREERFDIPKPAHVHQPMIQMIVDELRGEGKALSTGENGLRTQEVMDAALMAYYGGREDGFWKRAWPGKK